MGSYERSYQSSTAYANKSVALGNTSADARLRLGDGFGGFLAGRQLEAEIGELCGFHR